MPSFLKSVKKGVSKAKNAVEKSLNVDLDGDGVVGKKKRGNKHGSIGGNYGDGRESLPEPVFYSFTGPVNEDSHDLSSQYQTSGLHYAASAPAMLNNDSNLPYSSNFYPSNVINPSSTGTYSGTYASTSTSRNTYTNSNGLNSECPYPTFSPAPSAPPAPLPPSNSSEYSTITSMPTSIPAPLPSSTQHTPYPLGSTDLGQTPSSSSQASLKPHSNVNLSGQNSSGQNSVSTASSNSNATMATFKVIVPPNTFAGMTIRIQIPGGQLADVRIPDGATPGTAIHVQLPNSSNNSNSTGMGVSTNPNQRLGYWPEWRSFAGKTYHKPPIQVIPAATYQLPPRPSGRKKALLIGINYFNTRAQLKGCINDVKRMKQWLLRNGFSDSPTTMLVLTDDQTSSMYTPTKQNILRGMQWLVEGASPGDSLFFHFSGHGAQEVDHSGAETDGLNETICPVDMKRAGMIPDDVIWDILVFSLPDGCRLTALMDCCHSGTGMDLPFTYNDYQSHWKVEVNPSHAKADVVLLSGCEDAQCSVDTYDKRRGAGGAMTNAFLDAHAAVQYPTFGQLMLEIQNNLRRKRYSQRPKLSATQTFNVHERIFELSEGFEMNKNTTVGRMVQRRFKPKSSFGNSGGIGGVGGMDMMLGLGAGMLLGSMLDGF